jgi:acetate kinase
MRILVLNAGSSSLKTSLVGQPGDVTVSRQELQRPARAGWTDALRAAFSDAGRVDAIGHRVVHGGERHTTPLLLSERVLADLGQLRDLAPLHNARAIEVVEAARDAFPELPQVACFDTAFHAALDPAARTYALPWEWSERWSLRRYGFHGLSVAWSAERAAALLDRPVAELGLVVAHLGSGCSVTAVRGGRSVDTSMGMTPLEGLMMGTRSGSVDPGLLLELLDDGHLTLDELRDGLQHRSGLLGVSAVSADLRRVASAADGGDERAALALEMFVRSAAAGIAAVATALDRLDALVFTAGIGENAGAVRAAICARLRTLGLPEVLNPQAEGSEQVLSLPGSPVAVLRVEAREDLVIAREVARLLG